MTTRENTPDYISEQLGTLAGKPLTPSELRVLGALLAGHVTRHSIADALNISHRTVGTHIDRIIRKAGAINTTDLVLMALGRKPGLLDFSEVAWR